MTRLDVLVVEDSRDGAASLCLLMDVWGHDVRVARDGREGVRLARERVPDVVLCDIGLPGLDGFEVARTLRADPATAGVRLIAISGYSDPATIEKALACGFERFLAKPEDPQELRQLLDESADE